MKGFSYVLLGSLGLLHGDLLLLAELGQQSQRLVVVPLVGQIARHLDLLLHLLGVVHVVDRENALSLNLLTVGPIRGRVDHDSVVHGRDHLLLHLEHASWLLHPSGHVHGGHAGCRLLVDEHLLLGSRLLVVLVLSGGLILVISLLIRISVDDSWLAERPAHLARNADL